LSDFIGCRRARLEEIFIGSALNCLQSFLTRNLTESWARQAGHRWRTCLFSPMPTLLACIYKQLSTGVSCRDVEDWAASLIPASDSFHSGDDFCEARKRLPEAVFESAFEHTWRSAPISSIWLVDGTGLSLPRSAANFSAFGRPHGKARMPNARLLLFSDAQSGAVTRADIVGCHEGEMRQFLRCLPTIPPGTTLVADRQFGSYLAFHEMSRLGIFAVTRLNSSRRPVSVQRLSEGDEIHVWKKPRSGSSAFADKVRELPLFQHVRVVRHRLVRKGYRPVVIELASNLLDATKWPADKLVELYALRWRIENDIRDLKLKHGLSMLTCKSEDTVRKEVWSALIAYNCVKVMQAKTGQCPRELSHERSRTIMLEGCSQMARALTSCLPMLFRNLLKSLAQSRIKRQERPPCPRALVRNTNADYPFLYRTRKEWYIHYLAA
jgi:hypothetical protein